VNCDDQGVVVVKWPNPGVYIDGDDYFADYCDAKGAVVNRGIEYDWVRHFWSLLVDYDFSLLDVADIWDEADPHDWNFDDGGNYDDDPARRLHDAAFTVGGQSMQDDYALSAADNGVDN
jgi:hypothetical protein